MRGAVLRAVRPDPAAQPIERLDQIPIVILGCHRSGTSLLRRCLNSHSRISCPAETLFLESLAAALDYPDAEAGFQAIGLPRQRAAADLRGLVDRWMRQHAETQGKPRWADKSPGVLSHLDGLDHLFGDQVAYVSIVRSGMDVATSLGGAEPRWWQLEDHLPADGDPYVAAARYWAAQNTALADFADRRPSLVHRITYERLVSAPEDTLRNVLQSVGEAFEPQVLDFNRQAHRGGLEDHRVSTTTRFEDRRGRHRHLPVAVQRRMWNAVAPVMGRLGYPAWRAD